MGDGNGGTQRRKDAMKSRRGIPAYAGMTGGGGGIRRDGGQNPSSLGMTSIWEEYLW